MFNSRSNNNSVVAINISDRSLEAVKIAQEGGSFKLLALSRLEIESGIIEDGKIIRADALADAVKQLLHQAKPMPIRDKMVVITIPESKIFSIASVISSSSNEQELVDMVRHRAAEVIPVEPELLVYDYMIASVPKTEIFYAATYISLIQEYIAVFDRLNVKIRGIHMESQALARAGMSTDREDNILLLDIGARTTIATIFRQGFIRETVTIPVAGDAMTSALARNFQLSVDEIEKIKAEKGLVPGNDNIYQEVCTKIIDEIIAEILRFYTFWRSRSSEVVKEIIVAGGSSQLPGLTDYLQAKLNMPVRLVDLPPDVSLDKAQLNVQKFLPVVGAAMLGLMGEKGVINFLKMKIPSVSKHSQDESVAPVTQPRKKIPIWRLISLIALLIISLGVFGFIWWRSTTPAVPVATESLDEKTLVVSFLLNTDSAVGSTEALAVRSEQRVLNADYQLSTPYWQRINKTAQTAGRDITNRDQMYSFVLNDLVTKTWNDKYQSLAGEYVQTGNYLFNAYPDFVITTSTSVPM